MRKLLSVALPLCIAATTVACGNSTSQETTSATETVQETTSAESADETLSELDAVGDIEVEKELFDVTVTVPADFVGETTQEELDAKAKESGYKVTLNDDGSATYTMSKSQHKKMMDELSNNINTALTDMIGSEDYPNFTDIKANDDFTQFTVTTKSEELNLTESISVMGFYMYGGMYNIFNGTAIENVHVDFVNADTGEIISSSDSKDMAS